MKKLSRYMLKKIESNLINLWENITDEQVEQGRDWYRSAHQICTDIANRFDCDTMTAAGVIAALSPRNKWERNIEDAYKVFEAVRDGNGPESVKVCTFNQNKLKAFKIAEGSHQITYESRKIYSFMRNIALLDGDFVTVDVWHLRACLNKHVHINSSKVGVLAYEQIRQLTINIANRLNLKPFEFQAAIWVAIRR